ncbi:MAG: very short patch repair endonuclease [Bacteroidetes bacterium]|uniref:Very short patch repair endonuclease n=1 Tax=Candidatus Gallipaludibacter merdavium TaxID=2840839 RepID=A0A9D9HSX0_9BACT|nr:very short patch repair endonuclease [Candidatus Gallipaludibacter merdavium]
MDKLTKEQRHRCMSAIKEKNTTPELLVRKFLFSRGYRYRLNHPRLPGKPDIVLRKYCTVIFVNGCFWHGHEGCKYYVLPKSNTEFWSKKIERNKERDKEVQQELVKMGWHCITIWECWLKPNVRDKTLESLDYTLNHIYLKDRSIKPYTQEEEETLMAAEPERGYVDSPSDAE